MKHTHALGLSQDQLGRLSWDKFQGASILISGVTGLLGINIAASLCAAREQELFDGVIVGTSKSGQIPPEWGVKLDQVVAWSLGEGDSPWDGEFDIVFHASGYGQPARFTAEPIETLKLNSVGTLGVLGLLRPGGRFINFSSSEIYWGIAGNSANESSVGVSAPDHPRAMYIEGKRFSEALVNAATQMALCSGVNLRVALVYGPGVKWDDTRVLSDFIRSALVSDRIELRDSGEAVRNYLYVDDGVRLILELASGDFVGTVNVGGESRTTIRELAELVASETDSSLTVPPTDALRLDGAPDEVSISLERLRSLTGAHQQSSLAEGVPRTIDWFRFLLSMDMR